MHWIEHNWMQSLSSSYLTTTGIFWRFCHSLSCRDIFSKLELEKMLVFQIQNDDGYSHTQHCVSSNLALLSIVVKLDDVTLSYAEQRWNCEKLVISLLKLATRQTTRQSKKSWHVLIFLRQPHILFPSVTKSNLMWLWSLTYIYSFIYYFRQRS